jgi:hypothetical protein
LWAEDDQFDDAGKLRRRGRYWIKDGARRIRTGFLCTSEKHLAEKALAEYVTNKQKAAAPPSRERGRAPSEITIAEALRLYYDDASARIVRPKELQARCDRLASFFKGKCLDTLNSPRCREYVAHRAGKPWQRFKTGEDATGKSVRLVSAAMARRELEDLRAAARHCWREGYCAELVPVTLPEKSEPRYAWLTRSEAARIIWAAYRHREVQGGNETDRYTLRHVDRFLLVGLYTGTRAGAICSAGFVEGIDGRGYIDLERGVFYRLPHGRRQTKKRQPPAPLDGRLLAHMRRWHRVGIATHAAVEWNGKPVASVRRAFATAVQRAGLDPMKVTPHILRHYVPFPIMSGNLVFAHVFRAQEQRLIEIIRASLVAPQ